MTEEFKEKWINRLLWLFIILGLGAVITYLPGVNKFLMELVNAAGDEWLTIRHKFGFK